MTTAANGTAATLEACAPHDAQTYPLAIHALIADLDKQQDTASEDQIRGLLWRRRALRSIIDQGEATEPDQELNQHQEQETYASPPGDLVPGVDVVHCRSSARGGDMSHGVYFGWTMRIRNRHGDAAHADERTCSVDVYVMPTEDFGFHRDRGLFSYTSAQDLGTGWTAVCDLTFDGISERKESGDPESRAMLKPFGDDLLKWLESRGDMGYSEVCRSTNGRTHIRFDLTSVESPDDENAHPVIELTFERDEW